MSVQTLDQRLAELRTLRRRVDEEIRRIRSAIADQSRSRRRVGELPPCGTEQGYQWHRRHGEARDRDCLDAHAAYERERAAERRRSERWEVA